MLTEEARDIAVRMLAVGQSMFPRGTVKDCVAWSHDGETRIAWICDPLKMITNLGVGAEDSVVRSQALDYALKKALGLKETQFSWDRGTVGSYDMLERITHTIRMVSDNEIWFTLIPEGGWPWPADDGYFSAAKKKVLPSQKPEWAFRVPERKEIGRDPAWGINFCQFFGDDPIDGRGLGNVTYGDLDGMPCIVTHVASARGDEAKAHGWQSVEAWKAAGRSVKACGGLLFVSLAVGPIPATNFGMDVLVGRLGLALEGLKPYRSRGPVSAFVYDTDAWTVRVGDYSEGLAISAFDQMHGNSDYMHWIDNHVWPLGAPTGNNLGGGPAEATSLASTKKLASELRKRFKTWKEDLTPEQIAKVQDKVAMTTARYPYVEAKVNGVTPISAFPFAVCPRQHEATFSAYLKEAGWNGELIVLDVPDEIYRAIEDDEWLDQQVGRGEGSFERRNAIQMWAGLQYGRHVTAAVREAGEHLAVRVE